MPKDTIDWKDRRLVIVTKIELYGGEYDTHWLVGEVTGVMADTALKVVEVTLPFDRLPMGNEKGTILDFARRDGVFAQRIGLLDDGVIRRNVGVQLPRSVTDTKEQ